MKSFGLWLSLVLLLTPLPALAVTPSLTLTLPDPGDWKHVSYICEDHEGRVETDYINAAPNFLALVPIDGKTVIFANILSGSGARYVAGKYQWWTKGPEAQLIDLTADKDAPPLLTCLEANDTP